MQIILLLFVLEQCTSASHSEIDEAIEQIQLVAPEDSALNQSSKIELQWKLIKEVTNYEVNVSEVADFGSTIIDTTVINNTVEISLSTQGKTYYWRVIPIQETEAGEWSEVWSFTTAAEVIEPVKVALVAPENGEQIYDPVVEFKWEPLDSVSGYYYQISDSSDFLQLYTDTLISSSAIEIENLEPEKEYIWRVFPIMKEKPASWSEVRKVVLKEAPFTHISELLLPQNQALNVSIQTQLKWSSIENIDNYELQISRNAEFSEMFLSKIVQDTIYQAVDLDYGSTFYWRIKGTAVNGSIGWSTVFSFQTEPEPYVPSIILGTELLLPEDNADKVSTDLLFTWMENDKSDDYEIMISDDINFKSYIVDEVVTTTSYQAGNLIYNHRYYWKVKATAANGDFAWSDVRTFKTIDELYTSPPPPSQGSFIAVQNSDFVNGSEVFRFSGTNAYYLPNYQKVNSAVVERALDLFQDTGIKVVRMWGFYDGYDCGYSKTDATENVIQTAPGVYSEDALKDLDQVIASGKDRGIMFLIPFINFWDELGGVCQYNIWAGASNPSTNMEFFLSNTQTQKWYKEYISMLLNRVNTVTGVAYKNEPAIFGWEIMNEGRNRGKDAQVMRDWYQEIAQYIKSIDSNHLVSTGEEGFDEGTPTVYSVSEYSNTYTLRANEGTSYIQNTSIPEIDFGGAHWYPTEFGFGTPVNEAMLTAQYAWIKDHKTIAESVGKPFIIGEFGYPGWGNANEVLMYNTFYEQSETIGLDGDLLWQLTADGTKCWEYGGNICYPEGRADIDLYNRFKQHVTYMRNLK